MIILNFNDFSRIARENNRRIYYYQMNNILELAFITEGVFTKTLINLDKITNKEQFFAQDIFLNSVKLQFRIPNPINSNIGLSDEKIGIIQLLQPLETKLRDYDLQKDGVKHTGE